MTGKSRLSNPVIPAEAGIQRIADAIENARELDKSARSNANERLPIKDKSVES